MDKDVLLPEVPKLEGYANRTKGLGTWKTWEENSKKPGWGDPYHEWLAGIKEDPALDLANTNIQAQRGF